MPIRIICPIAKRFMKWFQGGADVYLLKGNPMHEGEGVDYNGGMFPVAVVIEQPEIIPFDDLKVGVSMVPFMRKDQIISWIKKTKDQRKSFRTNILMIHYALAGAKLQDYEVPLKDALTHTDLVDFDFVFAGHYHSFQQPWTKAIHVGSPYRISFSERDWQKGFVHLKINNKGVFDINFVPLLVPNMKEFYIDQPDPVGKGLFEDDVTNCFVKVVFHGTEGFMRTLQPNISNIKEHLITKGALGVSITKERTKDENEVREVRIQKSDTPEKMMDRYIQFTKDQTTALDQKRLRSIGILALKGGKK